MFSSGECRPESHTHTHTITHERHSTNGRSNFSRISLAFDRMCSARTTRREDPTSDRDAIRTQLQIATVRECQRPAISAKCIFILYGFARHATILSLFFPADFVSRACQTQHTRTEQRIAALRTRLIFDVFFRLHSLFVDFVLLWFWLAGRHGRACTQQMFDEVNASSGRDKERINLII